MKKKPYFCEGIKRRPDLCSCSPFVKLRLPSKKLCKKSSSGNLYGISEMTSLDQPSSILALHELEPLVSQESGPMSLSVPYHPYLTCLICGKDGKNGPGEKILQRCSNCKSAPYCCRHCQRLDWRVHRRECGYLKEENDLAEALAEINPTFRSASDGRALRKVLIQTGKSPLMFVLKELRSLLESSMQYWDPVNPANGMAVSRMESLFKVSMEECQTGKSINWVRLSSNLFGTVMIHRVINEQALEGYKFGQNAWFESYLHNFGEVCDRIKLYAILQENDYGHFLPDDEFPLLRMKEPITIQGFPHFPPSRLKLDPKIVVKCMVCTKALEPGPVISSHDPDRSADRKLPRLVNYLPPRPPPPSATSFMSQSSLLHAEQRLKTWLHMVARIKSLPKEYVCGEECEQHAIYGRLFNSHPLEPSKDIPKDCDS